MWGGNLHEMSSQYSLNAGDLIIIFLNDLVDGQFRTSLHDAQGNEKRPTFLTDGSSFLEPTESLIPVEYLFFAQSKTLLYLKV